MAIGGQQSLSREHTEEGNTVIDQPDTPTSQSTAARWTFYRRFGLLLRTHLDRDGATLSLHEVAGRTRGRVTADQLITLLELGARAQPDAVTCVLLAQAFGVDPDYFVDDAAVADYIATLDAQYVEIAGAATAPRSSLQARALAVAQAAGASVAFAR